MNALNYAFMTKTPVGVLGATGAVGQRFIQLLADHPWFEVAEVAASDRSAGKTYAEACTWRLAGTPPSSVARLTVTSIEGSFRSKLLFSGLDSSVAGEAEAALSAKGHAVVSNSRNHRMDPDVPLLIPEINPDHLDAVALQKRRTGGGYIVTNPNCSVVGLAMALAPLDRAIGIQSVAVVTLQALSGAGYPGVVITDGSVQAFESEPQKILGSFSGGAFTPAPFPISSSVHRVAVVDGHSMAVFLRLARRPSPAEACRILADFHGEPQQRELPTAPRQPIHVLAANDRPQPRLDRDREGGMAVSVGRVPCALRSSRRTSSSDSRLSMCWLNEGCAMCKASAAAVMLLSSTTLTK